MSAMSREALGRLVRETWVQWAEEQPDPKPSWLAPWEELDEGQQEVDMRIGEAVAERFADEIAAQADITRIAAARTIRSIREEASAEADQLRTELEHARAAVAGDSEGARLWMLDCGELVEKHRAESVRLRELLDEVGVLAANAPEDGDSFAVCQEITMEIAAARLSARLGPA